MDQAIKMTGRFLDLLTHVIVAIEVENIVDEVKGVGVILNFGIQPRQVKPISQVLFIDFAEVLVSTG
jgi:hypothetical protein